MLSLVVRKETLGFKKLNMIKTCGSLCSKMVCYALNIQGSILGQDTVNPK
jgi:hypothetical protein